MGITPANFHTPSSRLNTASSDPASQTKINMQQRPPDKVILFIPRKQLERNTIFFCPEVVASNIEVITEPSLLKERITANSAVYIVENEKLVLQSFAQLTVKRLMTLQAYFSYPNV